MLQHEIAPIENVDQGHDVSQQKWTGKYARQQYLCHWAKMGNVSEIERIIRTATQQEKNKALVAAAYYGELEMVEYLLDDGANPNDKSSKPLRFAVLNKNPGSFEVTQKLISLSEQEADGYRVFRWASKCRSNNQKILDLLDAPPEYEDRLWSIQNTIMYECFENFNYLIDRFESILDPKIKSPALYQALKHWYKTFKKTSSWEDVFDGNNKFLPKSFSPFHLELMWFIVCRELNLIWLDVLWPIIKDQLSKKSGMAESLGRVGDLNKIKECIQQMDMEKNGDNLIQASVMSHQWDCVSFLLPFFGKALKTNLQYCQKLLENGQFEIFKNLQNPLNNREQAECWTTLGWNFQEKYWHEFNKNYLLKQGSNCDAIYYLLFGLLEGNNQKWTSKISKLASRNVWSNFYMIQLLMECHHFDILEENWTTIETCIENSENLLNWISENALKNRDVYDWLFARNNRSVDRALLNAVLLNGRDIELLGLLLHRHPDILSLENHQECLMLLKTALSIGDKNLISNLIDEKSMFFWFDCDVENVLIDYGKEGSWETLYLLPVFKNSNAKKCINQGVISSKNIHLSIKLLENHPELWDQETLIDRILESGEIKILKKYFDRFPFEFGNDDLIDKIMKKNINSDCLEFFLSSLTDHQKNNALQIAINKKNQGAVRLLVNFLPWNLKTHENFIKLMKKFSDFLMLDIHMDQWISDPEKALVIYENLISQPVSKEILFYVEKIEKKYPNFDGEIFNIKIKLGESLNKEFQDKKFIKNLVLSEKDWTCLLDHSKICSQVFCDRLGLYDEEGALMLLPFTDDQYLYNNEKLIELIMPKNKALKEKIYHIYNQYPKYVLENQFFKAISDKNEILVDQYWSFLKGNRMSEERLFRSINVIDAKDTAMVLTASTITCNKLRKETLLKIVENNQWMHEEIYELQNTYPKSMSEEKDLKKYEPYKKLVQELMQDKVLDFDPNDPLLFLWAKESLNQETQQVPQLPLLRRL